MTTRSHSVTRRNAARSRRSPSRTAARGQAARRRRRLALVIGVAVLAALAGLVIWPLAHHAVREIALPLRHEDIIRQQARKKDLDPALIAGVIYAESKFRDGQVSSAGAQGLMQLTPDTAKYIAHKSGGIRFVVGDLGTPQVNISYGAYYLRYLLDRYGGNETFALAAYNAGEGNVDRWISSARAENQPLRIGAIPYAETRAYVRRVEGAQHEYSRTYRRELGL
jgi:soluble lytic murein transglycosylase